LTIWGNGGILKGVWMKDNYLLSVYCKERWEELCLQGENMISRIHEFDFVFSFAGEDRTLVEEIQKQLLTKGYHIFYDYNYQEQLTGQDLYRALRDIYRNKGKFVVCFISDAYARKKWTNLEFTAVKERLLDTFFAEGFLIPILIGNVSILKDIPTFIGFYRHTDIDKTVDMLCKKFDSCIEEDILIDDIQCFIEYIQENVFSLLQRQRCSISQKGDLFNVHENVKMLTLRFATDVTAQLPCIMVFEYSDSALEDTFPALIVTWHKCPHLRFFIHIFSEYIDKKSDELTFDELVGEIGSYIKKRMEGIE
jgi:hypothetical protein